MRKQISQYLFERIKNAGVDCTFGIPGDYILPLYAAQQRFGMRTVVMTHEPGVGFAADAYARMKGLGVALVTYGAGGLNMINPTALAYAEESPLLIVSGAPETKHYSQKALLHHCVKTFSTQKDVYAEVTAANAIIDDNLTAKQIIDHVFKTILSTSHPGYLELPRDLVNAEIEVSNDQTHLETAGKENFNKLTQKIFDLIKEQINNARQTVIIAGHQLSRFGLLEPVCSLSESLNIPVVTSILGKSSFPESHPNFIGTYFGLFGSSMVREFVEDCDCIIVLGAVLTEMETGGFTAKLPAERLILINNEEITIGLNHISTGMIDFSLKTFLPLITSSIAHSAQAGQLKKFNIPEILDQEISEHNAKDNLSVNHMIAVINQVMDESLCIVCDVGDCLYAGMNIKTDCFVAPGYYSSMGFGVPASIGIQIADKTKRPIVLVGDGGFQMTGTELASAVREKLSPIVIVFNNASYAMLKFIDQERAYYGLPKWDYVGFAKALGAQGFRAQTCLDFDSSLRNALKSDSAILIDAQLSPNDISPTLRRLTDHFGRKVRAVSA